MWGSYLKRDSLDPAVQTGKPHVRAGRKWNRRCCSGHTLAKTPGNCWLHTTGQSWLRMGSCTKEMVQGQQHGNKQKNPVVARMEEEMHKITAVSQQQLGRWTTWEAVTTRTITWADLWRTPQARPGFQIRATYDLLPSPWNLLPWYGVKVHCQLCNISNPDLKHILSDCKTALSQGMYRKLAETQQIGSLEATGLTHFKHESGSNLSGNGERLNNTHTHTHN